jgi:hypothetical protein
LQGTEHSAFRSFAFHEASFSNLKFDGKMNLHCPAGGPPQADDFFGSFCIKAKRTEI